MFRDLGSVLVSQMASSDNSWPFKHVIHRPVFQSEGRLLDWFESSANCIGPHRMRFATSVIATMQNPHQGCHSMENQSKEVKRSPVGPEGASS